MINIIRILAVLTASAALSGCGLLDPLTFSADENSGIENDQTVHIAYVNSTMRLIRQGSQTDLATELPPLCAEVGCLRAGELPSQVEDLCMSPVRTPPPSAAELAVASAAVPFIVAGGQAAFDAIVGAIDSRRAEIRKAAVRAYGTTQVVNNLALGSFAGECVIVWRRAAGETAMVSVYLIERHNPESNGRTAGLTMTPLYLRVDQAAAETRRNGTERGMINLNQTITIAAVQVNPVTNVTSVEPISTSPFSYSGIGLRNGQEDRGVGYINLSKIPDGLSPGGDEQEVRRPLVAPRGPIFVPLRDNRTVGSISVAVVERGSEANLDDVSATEKATRASIRGAIGSSIQEALKD